MKLSPNEKRIYDLLSGGRVYTCLGIMRALMISDPRGHMAGMRRKGVQIVSEWRRAGHGKTATRFKIYHIKQQKEDGRQ